MKRKKSSSPSSKTWLWLFLFTVLLFGGCTVLMARRLNVAQSENVLLSRLLDQSSFALHNLTHNQLVQESQLLHRHRRRGAGHQFDHHRYKVKESVSEKLALALERLRNKQPVNMDGDDGAEEQADEGEQDEGAETNDINKSDMLTDEKPLDSGFIQSDKPLAVILTNDGSDSWGWRASTVAYDILLGEYSSGVVILVAETCGSRHRELPYQLFSHRRLRVERVPVCDNDGGDPSGQTADDTTDRAAAEALAFDKYVSSSTRSAGSPSSYLLLETETLIGGSLAAAFSQPVAEHALTTTDPELGSLSGAALSQITTFLGGHTFYPSAVGTLPAFLPKSMAAAVSQKWVIALRKLLASIPLSVKLDSLKEFYNGPPVRPSLLLRIAFAHALSMAAPSARPSAWQWDAALAGNRHVDYVSHVHRSSFITWRNPVHVWLPRLMHWRLGASDFDGKGIPSPRPLPRPAVLYGGPLFVADRVSAALVHLYGPETHADQRQRIRRQQQLVDRWTWDPAVHGPFPALSAPFEVISRQQKQERLRADGQYQLQLRQRYPPPCNRDLDRVIECDKMSGLSGEYVDRKQDLFWPQQLDRELRARIQATERQPTQNPNYQTNGVYLDEPVEDAQFAVHSLRRLTPITNVWPSVYPSFDTEADWEQLMRARFGADHWDRDQHNRAQADSLQRALYQSQHPASCADQKFVLVDMRYPGVLPGLGTFLVESMRGLFLAFNTGRVLVVSTHSFYWAKDNTWCDAKAYTCYWTPVSQCTEADFGVPESEYTPLYRASGDEKVIITYGAQFGMAPADFEHCVGCRHALPQAVREFFSPRACRRCTNSRFWIDSQFARYVFRQPQPALQRLVERARRQLQFDQRPARYGLHIRRTDKIKGPIKESVAHAFDKYLLEARRLAGGGQGAGAGDGDDDSRLLDSMSALWDDETRAEDSLQRARALLAQDGGPHWAFVSSDEAQILSEADALHEILPNVDGVLFDAQQPRVADGAVTSAHLGKQFNATAEAMHGFKDMLLLANSTVFVGSGSSFFTRASLRLFVSEPGSSWFVKAHSFGFVEQDPWGAWPFSHSYQF